MALLSHGLKAVELHDLTERLAAVEAELANPLRTDGRPAGVNGKARV
jgi:hypothetical protein